MDATFNVRTPSITVGPTEAATIDVTGMTEEVECDLSLTVTDASARRSSSDTTITIRCGGERGVAWPSAVTGVH